MTDEQVGMFQSDFRFVADYFVQMRKTGTYNGSKEDIVHVQVMTYLARDNRFKEAYEESRKEGVVIHNMCEALDQIEARGRENERKEGLSAMVTTLKKYINSPEGIWEDIVKNEHYKNVTLQQVKKYY